MKYEPNYISPRELSEIFPEGKAMVKRNIKLYEHEKQILRDAIVAFQLAVKEIALAESKDEFFIWFWAQAYVKYAHLPDLVSLDKEIARLHRQLYYYERPPESPHAVTTRGTTEDWEEKVRRAKATPLPAMASPYLTNPRHVGNRIVARCPFHTEKTPSFAIFIDTNTYHCFGCQANGDVIDFLMKLDGIPFADAVKRLG